MASSTAPSPSGSNSQVGSTPINRYSDYYQRKYGPNYAFSSAGLQSDLYSLISGSLIDVSGWMRNVFDPDVYEINASGRVQPKVSGVPYHFLDDIAGEKVTSAWFQSITATQTVSFFSPPSRAKINKFVLNRVGWNDMDADILNPGNSWKFEFEVVSGVDAKPSGSPYVFNTAPGGWSGIAFTNSVANDGHTLTNPSAVFINVDPGYPLPLGYGDILRLKATKTGGPFNVSGLTLQVHWNYVRN